MGDDLFVFIKLEVLVLKICFLYIWIMIYNSYVLDFELVNFIIELIIYYIIGCIKSKKKKIIWVVGSNILLN